MQKKHIDYTVTMTCQRFKGEKKTTYHPHIYNGNSNKYIFNFKCILTFSQHHGEQGFQKHLFLN